MSADHKRPLYAFVIVAVMCAVIIANTLRSEAVMGFLADRAAQVVHGVTLSHEPARGGILRADAAPSPSAAPWTGNESSEPPADRSTSQPAAPSSHPGAGQQAVPTPGAHTTASAPPTVAHRVVHRTGYRAGHQPGHQVVHRVVRQVSRGVVHRVVEKAVRRAVRDVVRPVGHAAGRHGRGHAAAHLLQPVSGTEQQVVRLAARSVAATLQTSRSAATDLVLGQLTDLTALTGAGDQQPGPGLALGQVMGSGSQPDQQGSAGPPAGGSEQP